MKTIRRISCVISFIFMFTLVVNTVHAAGGSDINAASEDSFVSLINKIEMIKDNNPGLSEDEVIVMLEKEINNKRAAGDISEIWSSLTDSEKKLLIRYPLAALKVNNARNVATSKTQKFFGYNGLGDRSDAFRHTIWNAKMVTLIGVEKAELFATAHEDKDTTGYESDGFSKVDHRNMDLHNNIIGRNIGQYNLTATDEQLAQIVFTELTNEGTALIWLHE